MQMRASTSPQNISYLPQYPFHSHIRSFVCFAPFSDGDGQRPDNLISFVDRTDCSHCTPSLLPFLSSVFAGSFCPPSFDCVSSCAGLLLRDSLSRNKCHKQTKDVGLSRTHFSMSGFPFPISSCRSDHSSTNVDNSFPQE